jgi:hypothetical protein
VAADIEEGAAVAEAVLEAGQVVADAFEGAKPPDEAGGDPLAGDPGRNLTPIIAACCPMVGANCRGNLETVAKGMAYRRGLMVRDDGSGSGLCEQRHLGLPRFRALHAGGNTPTSCLAFYYLHRGYNAPRAVRSRGGRRRWIGLDPLG